MILHILKGITWKKRVHVNRVSSEDINLQNQGNLVITQEGEILET